jgi:hypothetical protein
MPAWVLIGFGVIYEVIHFLEAVDFVMEFWHRPVVQWTLRQASRPEIVLVLILVGFVWLAILVSGGERENKEGVREDASAPDVAPEKLSTAKGNAPVRSASTPETALGGTPNIIVLETVVRPVAINEGRIVEDPNSNTLAATVSLRNDAVRGRQVGEMSATKAHLRFTALGTVLGNIDAGCWLGEEYNSVDFAPGDTRTLVIGLRISDDPESEITIAIPDDRRVDSDTWLDLKWKKLETAIAGVHVKLVGGWPKVHVFEFDFLLTVKPDFKIISMQGKESL